MSPNCWASARIAVWTQASSRRAVGGAIMERSRHSVPAREVAADLLSQMQASGMRVLNTFANFWHPDRFTDLDVRARFHGTGTWSGSIFGTANANFLDDIAVDNTTAGRVTHSFGKGAWPYPSDHRALGVQLDLSLPLALDCTYSGPRKPIGLIAKFPARV